MIEEPVDARGISGAPSSATGAGRARRLFAGWSANLFQMILGVTQQVALVPVFLHFWSGEVLAAWLVVYAVGNLVLIADCGLQFRAINRFLAFKSSVDCDSRTARFYAAMLRIYLGLAGLLVILSLVGTQLLSPSAVLGFRAIPDFDAAFVVMTAGMLLTLPSGLVSGDVFLSEVIGGPTSDLIRFNTTGGATGGGLRADCQRGAKAWPG